MLTLYQCKPAFQNRLRPLVRGLAHLGITPNQVTVAAILVCLSMGGMIAYTRSPRTLLALPLVLLLRMALNTIDGLLARDYGLTTALGNMLNELGDVVSDVALYLPFGLMPGISASWIVAVVILASLTELTGVLGAAMVQQRCYAGPMGKSDRTLIFGLIALGLGLGLDLYPWLSWAWLGVVVLQLVTIVNRMRITLREVESC